MNFGSDLGSYLNADFSPGNTAMFSVPVARNDPQPQQNISNNSNMTSNQTNVYNTTTYTAPAPQVPIGSSGVIVFNKTP